MNRALFLDRDGVINHDAGYVHRIADFHFLDGIFALCRTARAQGLQIHVVTNQAGIGRGYYTEADFTALTRWMEAAFAAQGAPLTAVHHCPHHPQHGIGAYRAACACRKPAPGMILAAAAAHDLDLSGSTLIGDKASDMQAGRAAGVGRLILLGGSAQEAAHCPPGVLHADLLAQAEAIMQCHHDSTLDVRATRSV